MTKEQKTDELVAKILQILSWQQVITNQGTNYTGEKDWALNQILNLISQEKEKMIEEIKEYKNKECMCEWSTCLCNEYIWKKELINLLQK